MQCLVLSSRNVLYYLLLIIFFKNNIAFPITGYQSIILLFHYTPKAGNCVISRQNSDTAYAPLLKCKNNHCWLQLTLLTNSCFLQPLNPYKSQAEEKNNWIKLMTTHNLLNNFCVVRLQPSSVATDGSPLLGSISTIFRVSCCHYTCFRRFEVVFLAVERVLVPPGHNLHLIFIFYILCSW